MCIFNLHVYTSFLQVLKLQAAIKYAEDDLPNAKVSLYIEDTHT